MRMNPECRRATVVGAALCIVAACSPPQASGISTLFDRGSTAALSAATATANASYLYTANSECQSFGDNGCVLQFRLGAYDVPTRIIKWGVGDPSGIALDAKGNLYVANRQLQTVTVYSPNRLGPVRTLTVGKGFPQAIAVDPNDNIYVANSKGTGTEPYVLVFAPGQQKATLTLIDGITSPKVVTTDRRAYVYVANEFNIAVYPPESAKPSAVIKKSVSVPLSLAFDSSGNLYVANSNKRGRSAKGWVAVYEAKTFGLLRTITSGLYQPTALAFAKSGNLFVASSCFVPYSQSCNKWSVAVYPPNSSTPNRMITDGIQSPNGLALGPSGNLFVANCWACGPGHVTVPIYPSGKSSPSKVIDYGRFVAGPTGIAIWSP
jgi:hypothetical protein